MTNFHIIVIYFPLPKVCSKFFIGFAAVFIDIACECIMFSLCVNQCVYSDLF